MSGSPFDVSHHVGFSGAGSTFGTSAEVHGRTSRRVGFGDVGPWERRLAECHGHVCMVNRNADVFDLVDGVRVYVGHAFSDRDAISRWKNFLMPLGVRTEDADV